MRKYLSTILLVFTIISYLSIFISPSDFWLVGFFSLIIPAVIGLHLFLLLFYIRKFRKKFFYHLIVLLVGFAYLKATYSISINDFFADGVKVLSYNVRVFNNYAQLDKDGHGSSRGLLSWVLSDTSDIKCFQEYYNKDASEVFDIQNKLRNAGWKNTYCRIVFTDKKGGEFGIAIFSKYPIIRRGDIEDEKGEFMNSIFCDMVINSDTVRIYNSHLESMSIDEENVVNTERLRKSYVDTGYRLRYGFAIRARQVEALAAHIAGCPHKKIILCGDLNELPYSYPYFSLKSLLNNAFEKAGNGFGFSYNGKLFFLRIDNQFFSDDLEILNFHTHRNVKYSDHFPITATYRINE